MARKNRSKHRRLTILPDQLSALASTDGDELSTGGRCCLYPLHAFTKTLAIRHTNRTQRPDGLFHASVQQGPRDKTSQLQSGQASAVQLMVLVAVPVAFALAVDLAQRQRDSATP